MALAGGLEIPPELLELWRELIRPSSPRRYGAVAKNGHLLNPIKKRAISSRSLLPEIRDLWETLTEPQKNDWKLAAEQCKMRGWNLFVQDTAYRLKYGLVGLATPDILYQYKVGKVEINSPAQGAQIIQYHPPKYYKMVKVRGTKALYKDVPIYETLKLPLIFQLSYKSNMVATTAYAKIRVYAEIISQYQGRNITTNFDIETPLSSVWSRGTVTAGEVLGTARSYNIRLDFTDVRGTFLFDNVECFHTGSNWARDFRCNDINNELTKVNYQIEKSWEETFLPAGAAFDSVYHT